MASLNNDLCFFQFMSIASGSRKTYQHGWNCYISFCNQVGYPAFPVKERTLCLFVTSLARSLGYASIRTYLAAVRFRNIELGFSINFDHMQQLNMLMRGIKRVNGKSVRPKRSPITPDVMRVLKSQLRESSFVEQDKLMIWASFTTAFFGFLRSSEFCSPKKFTFHPESTLLVNDVCLSESVAILSIKVSKADPFRNGSQVRLAASSSSVCPFRALQKYLCFDHKPSLPLFQFSDGTFLTRQILSSTMKSLLQPVFGDVKGYSSHSFRIGAATTAAAADLPDWLIKALGRWSSNCFEQYIRTPIKVIDSVPGKLSATKF